MKQFFEQEIVKVIKKSELTAEGNYQLFKLGEKRFGLLESVLEEKKEEINFHYNIAEKKPFDEIRLEKAPYILLTLLGVADLKNLYREYCFSLNPINLYFDRNYQVYVMDRDLYERGIAYNEKQFIDELKAVIGAVIQKKYNYEDYFDGGMSLLLKNRFLKPLYAMESVEEITDYLKEQYEKILEENKQRKVEVNRTWYNTNRWLLTGLLVLLIMISVWSIYTAVEIQPRYRAKIEANNCFMDSNYIGVIEALEGVELKHLDKYQKTILAIAYVKSESLTPEQKEVILEKITVNGEEKLKEYWIHLGQLNTDEAVNIALQRSDDELLLYAYMTQRAMLEKDTEISGEEKKEKLADLEDKIEKLAEKYLTEE